MLYPLLATSANLIGALVNAAIPALCGIWMIWESTRIHATEPGDDVREPLTEEKAARKRTVFLNMGIVLIIVGIAYFVMDISKR